jgi:hypothetical protein
MIKDGLQSRLLRSLVLILTEWNYTYRLSSERCTVILHEGAMSYSSLLAIWIMLILHSTIAILSYTESINSALI